MGVGTSVHQSVTQEWLMSESHRIIRQLSSLISVTREIVITELDNLDNRAQIEIVRAIAYTRDYLVELASMDEIAKMCVDKKTPELDNMQRTMKEALVVCYKKYTVELDKICEERLKLHNDAIQLKDQADKVVEDCMRSENRLACLHKNISALAANVSALAKKIDCNFCMEYKVKRRIIMKLLECDRKILQKVLKAGSSIIGDVKKCIERNDIPEVN